MSKFLLTLVFALINTTIGYYIGKADCNDQPDHSTPTQENPK